MAILARGTLSERPMSLVFGSLTRRGFTGELSIRSAGKLYRVGWQGGAVIAAASPHPADSAIKLGITLGVITSTQAGEIAHATATGTGRDELDVVGEVARLSEDVLGRLARRVIGARAARALAPADGEFVIVDEVPAGPRIVPIDARWILYTGIRQHFTLERLAREVTSLAVAIALRPESDLTGFGFAAAEQPVVSRLAEGELSVVPVPAGLDGQVVHAMALALMATGECDIARGPAAGRVSRPMTAVSAPTERPSTDAVPAAGTSSSRAATSTATATSSSSSGRAATPTATSSSSSGRAATPTATSSSGRVQAETATSSSGRVQTATSGSTYSSGPVRSMTSGRIPVATTESAATSGRIPVSASESAATSGRIPVAAAATTLTSGRIPVAAAATTLTSGRIPVMPAGSTSTSERVPAPAPRSATAQGRASSPAVASPSPSPASSAARAAASRRHGTTGEDATSIRAVIAERLAMLDGEVDHYAMLGIDRTAEPNAIRTAYFELARVLHPDRLASLGVGDDDRSAQRVFAQINDAFTVLSSPARRVEYDSLLDAGGARVVADRDATAAAAAAAAIEAEERYRLGEMAMRRQQADVAVREFQRAVELKPDEPDYHALLGWALYVAARDKVAAATTARHHIEHALTLKKETAQPYLYLGRIARMEGEDDVAARAFRRALAIAPSNTEAQAELRVVEARNRSRPVTRGGLFSRLNKKL